LVFRVDSGIDKKKIKLIISRLINEEKLEAQYRDHKLVGNYVGRRECHVESNWLLIYKLDKEKIIFERTGTDSDLFR
jgi:mRNA interferase YafQ